MSRSNFYKNYYQSFMNENMNPLYRRYLEYLSSDLPDVSDIGGFIDVPTTAERKGLESLLDTTEDVRTPLGPMAPMNQQREGGGGPRTGRFGNLDPASERMVLIDGVPTRVYTDASGLLKTFDGRNVKGEVNTQTGAFDYEADAYGIPSYGLRSLTNPFDLQAKQIFAKNLAEKQAQEEAEKKAAELEKIAIEKAKNEREAQEKIKEEIRRKDLEDMRGGVGRNDDRPGGFGEGAGNFRDSDPTATEGSF